VNVQQNTKNMKSNPFEDKKNTVYGSGPVWERKGQSDMTAAVKGLKDSSE
jgi:hypothetical protein